MQRPRHAHRLRVRIPTVVLQVDTYSSEVCFEFCPLFFKYFFQLACVRRPRVRLARCSLPTPRARRAAPTSALCYNAVHQACATLSFSVSRFLFLPSFVCVYASFASPGRFLPLLPYLATPRHAIPRQPYGETLRKCLNLRGSLSKTQQRPCRKYFYNFQAALQQVSSEALRLNCRDGSGE